MLAVMGQSLPRGCRPEMSVVGQVLAVRPYSVPFCSPQETTVPHGNLTLNCNIERNSGPSLHQLYQQMVYLCLFDSFDSF